MAELIPLLDVEDVGRSLAFYESALDAKVEARWEAEGRVRWARIGFEGGRLMSNEPDGYAICFSSPRRSARGAAGPPRRHA